tara:strand:+ start:358 stop:837 length:480 start_codon:yes stop_codon:yes gene_type:complete
MVTLEDELGKLAAGAIDKRDRKEQEEKVRLGPHLEKEWKTLRCMAVKAAEDGNQIYTGTITTCECKFTVFKPNTFDVRQALPAEIRALKNGQGPDLSVKFGSAELAPSFELTIHFAKATGQHLATLKRNREVAWDKLDEDKEEDATAKGVKVGQKVEDP